MDYHRTKKQGNSRTSFAKKSKERNMLIAERFLSNIVIDYGIHPVSADGDTWYPMACRFLGLEHHIHSPYEKSLIERTMQYIKDRTECFDDYFPCRRKNCKLKTHTITPRAGRAYSFYGSNTKFINT